MLVETERRELSEQLIKIEKNKEKQRKLSLLRPNSKPNSRAQSCVNSPRNVLLSSDSGKNILIDKFEKFEKFEKLEKFDFQIQSEKKAALRNQSRKSSRVQNNLTLFYDDRDYYGNQLGGNNCSDVAATLTKTENRGILGRINSRTFNRSRPPSPTPSVLVEALQTLVLNKIPSDGSVKTKKKIANKFSNSSRDSGRNTDFENLSDDDKSKDENEEEEEDGDEDEGEDGSVDGSLGEFSAVSFCLPSANTFTAATGENYSVFISLSPIDSLFLSS